MNFAVHPGHRRQGIGSQMIDKLASKLSQDRRNEVTLAVRESNLAAQLFFKANGFLASGVIHGHYGDSDEDAYCFFRMAD